jgi:hypothetical protein
VFCKLNRFNKGKRIQSSRTSGVRSGDLSQIYRLVCALNIFCCTVGYVTEQALSLRQDGFIQRKAGKLDQLEGVHVCCLHANYAWRS